MRFSRIKNYVLGQKHELKLEDDPARNNTGSSPLDPIALHVAPSPLDSINLKFGPLGGGPPLRQDSDMFYKFQALPKQHSDCGQFG